MLFESITKPKREANNGFRNVSEFFFIKVQTFGLAGAEARSAREKPRSGEHMCARPEGEYDLEPKTLEMRSGGGDTY